MRLFVVLLCLLTQPLLAQDKIWVHTSSLPKDVTLPDDAQDYLYLEGENQSEKVANDTLAKPEQKERTLYRTNQIPNDKWWGTFLAYDKTHMAMRGADNDLPWHQLIWQPTNEQLAPALYDVYARVMITPGGSCELAITTNGDKPENITANDKPNITWVHVGSVQVTAETKQVQLHMRTKKSAVRVDTVLLIKVKPTQASVNLDRYDITTPAWHKDLGMVFTTPSAALGYRSDTPQHITSFHAAVRLKTDQPLSYQSIAPQADGTWQITLDHPGWFDLHIKATIDDGRELAREMRVAVLGDPIPEKWREKSVFGLWRVHGDPTLIKLASGRWDRAMTSFRDVTQQQAASTASASESVHPYAQKDGLAYTGVFSFGMPLWTMQLPDDFKPHGFGNPFYPAKDWSDVTRCVAAYAKSRALPQIMEMYNEPLAHWKGSSAQLVQYAHAVRKGLQSVDPAFKLGGPCLYSIRIDDLNNLAKAGLFDALDNIVMHAYVDGTPPEDAFLDRIVALNNLLKQYSQQDKPVYLTEFGWTAAEGTWQPNVDRWTQTRYVARSLALGWSQGIDALTYFVLRYDTKNTGEAAFSLLDQENRPEPGYVAFSGVSRWFAASMPIGHYQLTPTTHMVIGHREEKLQLAVWDTAGSAQIQLPFAITQIVDMFGKPMDVTPTISVSQDPIYLEAIEDGMTTLPTLPLATCTDMSEIKQEIAWPLVNLKSQAATLKPGKYAGFAKVNGQWHMQPVSLVSPLQLADVQMIWPLASAMPQVQVTLQSNVPDQSQATTLWLAERPENKVKIDIPANGMRQVQFAINNVQEAWLNKSIVMMQSPAGKVIEYPLDWTAMSASPEPHPGNWADFTAWAPFGKVAEDATLKDCIAQTRLTYSDAGLKMQVRVTDDEHHQPHVSSDPQLIWAADSIQLAFDVDANKPWQAGVVGSGLAGHRVFEYSIAGSADSSASVVAFRNRSYDDALPANAICPEIKAQITREADVTSYNVLIPWQQLGLVTPMRQGDIIGFALVVNDVDPTRKAGRHGLRLFKGIAQTKDAKQYGKVWLR